jgi:transcriptional regulator with XRE-family HTH domain
MTDQEDIADKNEQELNLFSAQQPENKQDEPEFAGFDGQPEAAGSDTADGADAGEGAETGFKMDAGSGAAPVADASDVVAPPPPQRKPAAPRPRPGIVAPPRSVSPSSSSQSPGNAAPAHRPLPHAIQQDQTLGQTLAAIRAGRGLSMEEVAASTRIRQEYLIDLEADKLLNRLPPVYISAYVRKLIDVYDLSPADAESLIEKMHGEAPQDPEALPAKLIESVNDGALVNEGENKRIRNITIIFFAVIAIIAAAIIWLVVLVLVRYAKTSDPAPGRAPSDVVSGSVQPAEAPVSQEILIDESELDALIVPETPTISVLKMDKTPGVRDTP